MDGVRTLGELGTLSGERVLVRASLNVPLRLPAMPAHAGQAGDGSVGSDYRIRRALPTLEYLRAAGARTILTAHLGRSSSASILPVFRELQKFIPVKFTPALFGVEVDSAIKDLRDGEILMLENTRSDPREVENVFSFARDLASHADFFINDAFADSHRIHASIMSVPQILPSAAGLLFEQEVRNLGKALSPESPSLFILGGAKFETKEPLIQKFLELYDRVFVGGAVANDFFKAKGYEVGTSAISSQWLDARELLKHPRLALPKDVVVKGERGVATKRAAEVERGEKIVDIGPVGLFELSDLISNSRFVLWNGPLGNYEEGFIGPTEEMAQLMSRSNAYSVVGGGDTVASIARLGLEGNFSFVSTGGGAMLEFLLKGTLPGLDALRASPRLDQ